MQTDDLQKNYSLSKTNTNNNNQTPIKDNNQVVSNLSTEYETIMNNESLSGSSIQSIINILRNNKVQYNSEYWKDTMTITILKHMPTYQIIFFRVQLGYFSLQVSVYCSQQKSCSHNLQQIQSRPQTMVYFANEKLAIKCMGIKIDQEPLQVFARALKQYCILKIASVIGVGPKVKNIGGFDMIFFQNCVQFGMQRCKQLRQTSTIYNNESVQILKHKLKLLHYFHIVHMDIKPANIMYSQQNKDFVFIDFGFSKIINQNIGFKTKTFFSGSINYCSNEMSKIFKNTSQKSIDLYYNDAHCLKLTIDQIINDKKKQQINTQQYDYENIFNKLQVTNQAAHKIFAQQELIIQVINDIFYRNMSILDNSQKRSILIKYGEYFVNFILKFPYNKHLKDICKFIHQKNRHKDISIIYSRRIQHKKQMFFKYLLIRTSNKSKEMQRNIFLKKIGKQTQKQNIIKDSFHNIQIYLQQNIKRILLNINQIKKLPLQNYYKMVAKAIDLRSFQCNQQQTLKILQLFYSRVPQNNQIITITEHKQIEYCYRYILKHFTKNYSDSFEDIIPLSILNLVIIEAIQFNQIELIIKQLGKKKDEAIKCSISLFRIYLVCDWIIEKINSRYTRINANYFLQFVSESLNQLKQSKNSRFVNYIQDLFNSFYNLQSIKNQYFLQEFFNYINTLNQLSENDIKQLMNYVVLERYKDQRQISNNQLKQIQQMDHYGKIRLQQCKKIQTIYIRVNCCKTFGFLKDLKNCFLGGKLIKQFYFYYAILIRLNPKQMVQFLSLQEFQQIFKYILNGFQTSAPQDMKKILLLLCDFLHRFKDPLLVQYFKGFDGQKLIKESLSKKKALKILTEIVDNRRISAFLSCTYELFVLYYELYCEKQKQILQINKIYDKIIKNTSFQCSSKVRNMQYHTVRRIELIKLAKEDKGQQMVKFCLREASRIINNEELRKQQSDFLKRYLGKAFTLLRIVDIRFYQQQTKSAYNMLMQSQTYDYVFSQNQGKQIYEISSAYTLFIEKHIPSFINFHQKLLQSIEKNPFSMNIHLYLIGLKDFCQIYKDIIVKNAENIMINFFIMDRQEQSKNPYGCLFVSHFLNFQLNSALFRKILIYLCKALDSTSLSTRVCVLQDLINFVLKKTVFENIRSKRRKIIWYANYLLDIRSNQYLCIKLQLTYLKKRAKRCNYSLQLYKKWQKFYDNLI